MSSQKSSSFHHLHPSQFPGLSQGSSGTLGDSGSDSGGDISCSKGTDMCHRPLVFLSSAPPSLPNGAPASAPYPQPLSPQGRLHHHQHHHHQHHPLHPMHGSHHHHNQPQMNQVRRSCTANPGGGCIGFRKKSGNMWRRIRIRTLECGYCCLCGSVQFKGSIHEYNVRLKWVQELKDFID